MSDKTLLEKIGELFTINTALIRKEIKESLEASETRIKTELREEFKKAISEI